MLPREVNFEAIRNAVPAYRYNGGDFAAWQREAREKLRALLGLDRFERCEPELQVEYTREANGNTETRFTFQSEPGYTVPCVMLRPAGEIKGYMICLQGHSTGMHNSLGVAKHPGDEENVESGDRDFAVQAAARGYAAIAVEQRCFGERGGRPQPDCYLSSMMALLRGRTTIGERVWDVSRLLDVLAAEWNDEGLPVYIMGNSGGGTASVYAAAAEPRIAGAIPSCSVCTWEKSIAYTTHCACNYVPNIANCFDMGDIAGLIAPRPYVQVNGKDDGIFLIDGAKACFEQAQTCYAAAGAPDKCRLVVGDAGHRFYAAAAWPAFEEARG